MALLPELPEDYESTRAGLHRLAAHVLGRRRADVAGRFGLRATPGGIGTPSFGSDPEVLRVAGHHLLRETTGEVTRVGTLDLTTASLADAAALAGVDLGAEFSVGHDTPAIVAPAVALRLDPAALGALAAWFHFGWLVIDECVVALGTDAAPSVLQLWPEHFDLGCDVGVGPIRTNLGASGGDAFLAEPYLYVGPWGPMRPGDPEYWNVSFGAMLGYSALRAAADPVAAAGDFLRRGIALLRS